MPAAHDYIPHSRSPICGVRAQKNYDLWAELTCRLLPLLELEEPSGCSVSYSRSSSIDPAISSRQQGARQIRHSERQKAAQADSSWIPRSRSEAILKWPAETTYQPSVTTIYCFFSLVVPSLLCLFAVPLCAPPCSQSMLYEQCDGAKR